MDFWKLTFRPMETAKELRMAFRKKKVAYYTPP